MIDMASTVEELELAAQYEDFTMDVKHRVLGEALYYLEVVENTHTIPGIEGVTITANMNMWCYPPPNDRLPPKSMQACLAGIWCMAKAGKLLHIRTILGTPLFKVLDYMDKVVKASTTYQLYNLVGKEVFVEDYVEALEDVQQRLHSLMEELPLMRVGYDTAKGRPHMEE
jgi:hypothetical protein